MSDSTTTGKKTNVGVIVGPIIGGIAALLILAALALWYRRKRRAASGAFTRAQFSPYALQASTAAQEAGASAPTTPRPSKLAAEANSPYAGLQAARSPQMSTHPSTSSVVSSPPPQTAQTQPPGIPVSSRASEVSSSAQPQSPASTAAVDRLIQIIADRIDRTHPPPPIRYDYGADVPPPEYGAL